ncbi:hypothetical protein P154DRAFT_390705, partial [Amniculicola lignicola CBS 123094]
PPPTIPWHPIPPSPSPTSPTSTCTIHLLQAGTLTIPTDLVLLPSPNTPNDSTTPDYDPSKRTSYTAPDYVFLIKHEQTGTQYLFDLGMRKDMQNLPPLLRDYVLPNHTCVPMNPADILKAHGERGQQPENVHAIIFSHLHFDHLGAGDAQPGFQNRATQMWIGPTASMYARPGYPIEEDAVVSGDAFPVEGERRIVEWVIGDEELGRTGDGRVGVVGRGREEGKYRGVEVRDPEGWQSVGAFERAVDVHGDGGLWIVDAPAHSWGHIMLMVRTKIGAHGDGDEFVVLAGDAFHHPALLKEPLRMARKPYATSSMHLDEEAAIDLMYRLRTCAERETVWVVAAHDFSVGDKIIKSGKGDVKDKNGIIQGLVDLHDWRDNGWKMKVSD